MIKKTIIITGGSSGLGSEIAKKYAYQNGKSVRLFLFGRSKIRLTQVAKQCRQFGALVYIVKINVEDRDLMALNLKKISNKFTIDIVYACAGVSSASLGGKENITKIYKIFSINFYGVINTISPLFPKFIHQRSGKIVLISSIAGILGISKSPSYCASKAAIKVFGEAIHHYFKQFNVHVSIVIPGYIYTPMTMANKFFMPFIIPVGLAAYKIIKNVEKNKMIIAFPLPLYLLVKIINILPNVILRYINSILSKDLDFKQ